ATCRSAAAAASIVDSNRRILMRYFAILIFAGSVFAQSPETDQTILQKLLVEVQQLRVAIQQSTLLGTRTQIALSQLQLQEGKVSGLSRDLAGVRDSVAHLAGERSRLAEEMKQFEEGNARSTLQQRDFELQLKEMKIRLEQLTTEEQRATARES